MSEPAAPQPGQGQQIPVIPWGWEFMVVGETSTGKLMMTRISRPPFEQLALIAVVGDMKRFHQALGEAIRQVETGIQPASQADIAALLRQKWTPPNGTHGG